MYTCVCIMATLGREISKSYYNHKSRIFPPDLLGCSMNQRDQFFSTTAHIAFAFASPPVKQAICPVLLATCRILQPSVPARGIPDQYSLW